MASAAALQCSNPLGIRGVVRPFLPLILLLVLFSLLASSRVLSAESAAPKNVLILNSFSDRSVFDSVDSLESAIRSRVTGPVDFSVMYLETQRFEDEVYEKEFADTVRHGLGTKKLDLVIVAAYPALSFALKHRDTWSPGVPIVFSYVHPGRLTGYPKWPGVTGTTVTVDAGNTVDLALRLHPQTDTVAVITNNSEFERYWLAAIHSALQRHQGRVKEIDLIGLPTGELLDRVAAFGSHTVILFSIVPQDSIQPAVGTYDTLASVGQLFPAYCFFPKLCLNHGGVGGYDYDEKEQTVLTARLASRVLAGERPEEIPIVHGPSSRVRVDWRQLRRWNISESSLPPGSEMLFREPTLWERGRKYILAAIVVIVAQSLLILGLLWQRARKKKAEAKLRESEDRFRRMADTTPALVWMCDTEGKITYLNERKSAYTGPDRVSGYGDLWATYIHPDDLKQALEILEEALKTQQPFSHECRLRRYDGTYRWIFDVASPRVNSDGAFAGFIGSAIDVTDQKVAQEALEKMSGRLIEAQEKERTRIARDLHDDICQRLALLSMGIEQTSHDMSGSAPARTAQRMEEIRLQCAEIAGDVQALSHQLHSSKLEYLGIVAAIRGHCKEFAKQHGVSVELKDENVPRHLPKNVSLCLFRVAQEALHNAAKYSGATHVEVMLKNSDDVVTLEVKDAGAGFDVEVAMRSGGLGLVSMQERVHLVHGRFLVESKPGAGTRIVAKVPVVSANGSAVSNAEPREAASTTGGM